MSSQHTTLRACVCVFLTHLQQVNWWDFTSSPCSPAPALWLAELCLDWHVSRVTDWWDGCLHTHTLTHTLTHILFTCSGLNPGTNRCERKQRLWAGRISAADVQLPSFTLTSGRLLLLSYDDGQLVPVKSGEERDEQMCDNRRKCRFEVSNSQQQWRIQRTPEGKADSLETHLH